jgi:hypothetical protein
MTTKRFCLTFACVAVAAPATASATGPPEAASSPFATGLTNPRHIRFGPDGMLYVAEAGIGGDQPATTCPPVDNMFTQDGPYLAGFSGRISRIRPDGSRETVADRLPSSHDGLGDGFGPSDIAWIGRTMYAVIEGGGCSRGLPDDPAGIVRIGRDGSYRYVADISTFIRANPVANEPLCGPLRDCEPDGVPHSLLASGGLLYVVETNHNSVLRVNPHTGSIRRLYDLSVQDLAPIILTRRHGRFFLGGFDGVIQTFDHRRRPLETFDEGYGPIVDLTFARGWRLLLRLRLRACPRRCVPSRPPTQDLRAPDPPASANPCAHVEAVHRGAPESVLLHRRDRCVLWRRHVQPRRRFLAYGTG